MFYTTLTLTHTLTITGPPLALGDLLFFLFYLGLQLSNGVRGGP